MKIGGNDWVDPVSFLKTLITGTINRSCEERNYRGEIRRITMRTSTNTQTMTMPKISIWKVGWRMQAITAVLDAVVVRGGMD